MQHASVYVTCPDRDTARSIARELLARRLVACANLIPIESIYEWDGDIREDAEVAMFLKTRSERVPEVVRAVEELHPFDVPCIVAFPLLDGSLPYLAWVDERTR